MLNRFVPCNILIQKKRDIQVKLLSHDFPFAERFFVEIYLYKKKWLINCSYNPPKGDIGKHLDIIRHAYSTKYQNVVILGNLYACVEDKTLDTFCKSHSFNSLIKQPTCIKNPENPSCIGLFLTNKPLLFGSKCVIETGLSDFHRMTMSVLKIHFQKLPPKIINQRNFEKFNNERFMSSSEEHADYSKNQTNFMKFATVF